MSHVIAREMSRRMEAMNASVRRVLAARPMPYDVNAPVSDTTHALDELMNQAHQRCEHCGGHLVSHDEGKTWNHTSLTSAHPAVPAGGWFQKMPRAASVDGDYVRTLNQIAPGLGDLWSEDNGGEDFERAYHTLPEHIQDYIDKERRNSDAMLWGSPMPHADIGEPPKLHAAGVRRLAGLLRTATLRKQAHDSGDGETIFHCPFCGSGDVVGGQDGTCSCGFCNKAFTVQVQPKFKNMPQTVNGQPYNIPGMPGGGPDAGVTDMPVPPDAQPMGDAPIDDADAGAPAPQDDAGGPPQSTDKPPWMKPSQATGVLVVDTGVALPAASAMRRLALRHADDPEAVLEDVRRSNRVNR